MYMSIKLRPSENNFWELSSQVRCNFFKSTSVRYGYRGWGWGGTTLESDHLTENFSRIRSFDHILTYKAV